MPKVRLTTPIGKSDVTIIGKTLLTLEKTFHVKFEAINGRKPHPGDKIRAGIQIVISGENRNVYQFGKTSKPH